MRDIHGAVWEFDDGGGDGGQGAFKGFDKVGFGGDIAECIRGVWDAEVCGDVN